MAIPLISDLLERFFGPAEDPHSRDDVKRRLKIVLAHDRLALDPQTLEMMRQEIIAVVSRYVEVDFDALEFSLATDQRVTALTANLPIRRIRPLGRGADQPIAPDAEAKKIELASQAEILSLDAQEAEAALRRFEETNQDTANPIHAPLDIDRTGLDDEESDTVSEASDELLVLDPPDSANDSADTGEAAIANTSEDIADPQTAADNNGDISDGEPEQVTEESTSEQPMNPAADKETA
ncbi:MAG: cell division topological specificity factor MinE [Cyanobacteria bacterium J06621_3]